MFGLFCKKTFVISIVLRKLLRQKCPRPLSDFFDNKYENNSKE